MSQVVWRNRIAGLFGVWLIIAVITWLAGNRPALGLLALLRQCLRGLLLDQISLPLLFLLIGLELLEGLPRLLLARFNHLGHLELRTNAGHASSCDLLYVWHALAIALGLGRIEVA